MDPKTLSDYLAVLPKSVFQIELTSGDFTIKLNMEPPGSGKEDDKEEGLPTDGYSQIPAQLREYFPQLATKDVVGVD